MGTNYYLVYNECKCCKRYSEVHLGKSSMGWKFTFQTIEDFPIREVDPAYEIADSDEKIEIKSWLVLREFLHKYVEEFKSARIRDEYNSDIPLDEFIEMINKKNISTNKSHYWEMKNDTQWSFNAEEECIDDEGHSFSRREFS